MIYGLNLACPKGWIQYGDYCYWRPQSTITVPIENITQMCTAMTWNGTAGVPLPDDVLESIAISDLFDGYVKSANICKIYTILNSSHLYITFLENK